MSDKLTEVNGEFKKRYRDMGDGSWAEVVAMGAGTNGVQINSVVAAKLAKGKTASEVVTCAVAGTDYAASGAMPAGTKYVSVWSASACVVAMGEVTSATVGVGVGAGVTQIFPVTVTGVAGDDTVHVQSATAGGSVRLTYLQD